MACWLISDSALCFKVLPYSDWVVSSTMANRIQQYQKERRPFSDSQDLRDYRRNIGQVHQAEEWESCYNCSRQELDHSISETWQGQLLSADFMNEGFPWAQELQDLRNIVREVDEENRVLAQEFSDLQKTVAHNEMNSCSRKSLHLWLFEIESSRWSLSLHFVQKFASRQDEDAWRENSVSPSGYRCDSLD